MSNLSRRRFLKNTMQTACIAGAAGATGSLLTACGGSASNSNGPVTLTFWHTYAISNAENPTLVNKVIPAFHKKYPHITIEAQDVPYDSMLQKLIASVAGGKGPDIIRPDAIWMAQLSKIGALVQLDDIVNQRKNEFYSGPLEGCAYKGHYYGLPLDTSAKVLFYNEDLLSRAGVSAVPTTTDEFRQACLKISALGNDTYGYAEVGTYDWDMLPWVWSFGGDVTNDTFTKATGYFNNANTVNSLEYLIDLYNTKALSPNFMASNQTVGPDDVLGQGKAGFAIDGPWAVTGYQQTYPNVKYGTALIPAGPHGTSTSIVGGENISIMSSCKNVDAAKEFAQFMTSEEVQRLMGTTGQMPILKSLANDPGLPSYFQIFNKQLESAKSRTVSPNFPKISQIFQDAFDSAFHNKATPQAALDSAAAQIDALLS